MTDAAWASVYERDSSDDGATPPLTPRHSVAISYDGHLSEEDEDDTSYSFSDSETSDDGGENEDDLLDHHNAGIGSGQPVPLASRRPSHKKRHAVRAATTLKGAILALDTRMLSAPAVVCIVAWRPCACGAHAVCVRVLWRGCSSHQYDGFAFCALQSQTWTSTSGRS